MSTLELNSTIVIFSFTFQILLMSPLRVFSRNFEMNAAIIFDESTSIACVNPLGLSYYVWLMGDMSTKDFSLKIKGLKVLKVPIFLTFLEWIGDGFLNLKFLLDKG